jgi:hypothetical protein
MTEEEIRNRGIRCALRHMHSLRVQALDERTANFAEACSYCEEMSDCKGNWLESIEMVSKESRFEENRFKITEYKKTICPNCNHENKKEANFCVNCGEKLRESCKCWVTKKDNYSCGEKSCPGYKLLTQLTKSEGEIST